MDRLNRGLRTLGQWCFERAAGEHNEETTLTMLIRKVGELEEAVLRSGWAASTEDPLSKTLPNNSMPAQWAATAELKQKEEQK